MAKKKTRKKHSFTHSQTGLSAPTPTAAPLEDGTTPSVARVAGPGYVGTDLRRIALIGGGLIALELILWYLFNHTSLGNTTYHLIKL